MKKQSVVRRPWSIVKTVFGAMRAKEGRRTNTSFLILHPSSFLRVVVLSRRKKSAHRASPLVGRVGSIERTLAPDGFVLVEGELWPARLRGGGRAERGRCEVRVVGARGHLLEVEALPHKGP